MLTTFAVIAGLFAGAPGKVVLDVSPSNAAIQIDGKRVRGKTHKVNAGKHRIQVRASGYKTQTRTVSVPSNRTVRVKFRLARTSAKAPVIGSKKKVPARKPVVFRPSGKTKKPAGKRPSVFVPAKKTTKKQPRRRAKTRGKVAGKTTAKRLPKKKTNTRVPVRRRNTRGGGTGRKAPPARGVVNNGTRGRRNTGGGSSSLRPLAVLSFVVGGLAITGGFITHGIAQDKADEFNASRIRQEKLTLKDDAETMDTVSTALYGVGVTGVVLGAVLLAVDPGPSRRASVSPLPGGGAMIGYGGTF